MPLGMPIDLSRLQLPTDENYWLTQLATNSAPNDFGLSGATDARAQALKDEIAQRQGATAEYEKPETGFAKWAPRVEAGLMAIAALHDLSSGNRDLRNRTPGNVAAGAGILRGVLEQRKAKKKEKLAAALASIGERDKTADLNYNMAVDLATTKQKAAGTRATAAGTALDYYGRKQQTAAAKGPKPLSHDEIELANAGKHYDSFVDKVRGTGESVTSINQRFAHLYPREHQLLVGAGQVREVEDPNAKAVEIWNQAYQMAAKILGNEAGQEAIDKMAATIARRSVGGLQGQ